MVERGRSDVPLPHGTVTFRFTDIEGSTRLLQEPGDEYAELLASHHHVRGQFGRHGGVEVNTQGDAFFVLGRAPPSRGRQPAELATYFSEIEFEFGADRSRGALPAEKTFKWYTRSMALLGQLQEVRDPSDR